MGRQEFFDAVQEVYEIQFNHKWGNGLLYDICKKEKYSWGDKFYLADKIWLIGRAYAASPERRYTLKDSSKKPNYKGDGTGDFFIELSQQIISSNDYKNLIRSLEKLHGLKFDKSEEDVEELRCIVNNVISFNDIIVEQAKQFDCKYNAESADNLNHRNHLSFCSKFLHFHMPSSFFIYDHYTEEGGKAFVASNSKCDKVLLNYKIEADLKNDLKKIYSDVATRFIEDDTQEIYKKYKEHCMREYSLCCYLKDNNVPMLTCEQPYYTRLADSVCQRVQKTK